MVKEVVETLWRRPRRRPSIPTLWVLLVAGLSQLAPPLDAQTLRVCFLAEDPPRSSRATMAGFDLDVMAGVAARLDMTLTPVWFPGRGAFSEIEETDLPLGALARGECDAVASVPGPTALGRRSRDLALTRPYYGAGFELVGPETLPNTLDGLEGLTVAVRLQSLAHFALQAQGIRWTAHPSSAQVLAALKRPPPDAVAADAALLFGPALAAVGGRPKHGWVPPVALRWNEHVAVRKTEAELLRRVNGALAQLEDEGRFEAWAKVHGDFFRPPFAEVSTRAALRELGIGGGRRRGR